MGQLVFQAALGGQVNLVGPNTASTFNLNVPAASDTLVARATTDTLTNKTLTSPVISGGTIDNAVIGGTTAVAGSFTTVTAGTSVTTPFVTSASATNLLLKSAGTTAVTIDTSQNVCIGTSTALTAGKISLQADLSAFNAMTLRDSGTTYGVSSYYTLYQNSAGSTVGGIGHTAVTSLGINATTDLQFFTAASEKMRLDASGNLGLGVTPSAWDSGWSAIQVSTQGASFVGRTGGNEAISLSNAYRNSASWKYITSTSASMYQCGNGIHTWFIAPSGTAGNAITFTQAMTLDASGNLGVGTSSPSYRLDVQKAGSNYQRTYNTLNNTAGWIAQNTTTSSEFGIDATGAYVAANGAYPITFQTNSAERMRIDSSGNLLVGATSIFASGKECIAFNGSSNAGISLKETTAGAGTFANFVNNSGSIIGQINQNGASNVSYVTSSDYRLKENIAPMTGALQTISQLKPCTYTWKLDGSAGQGFIAHELQEVVPDAVCGEKDAVNEDGSIKPQGIDTSFLVATLTAAIQELNAKFEAYKATHP